MQTSRFLHCPPVLTQCHGAPLITVARCRSRVPPALRPAACRSVSEPTFSLLESPRHFYYPPSFHGVVGIKRQKAPTEDYTPSDGEIVPLTASQPTGPSSRFSDLGTCVVAGAAGKTGRAIVQRLIQDGVPVRGLVRDILAAAQVLPGSENNVELFQGDVYQFSTLPAALQGSKALLIATGARPGLDPFGPYNVEYQGTLNLLAAAKQAGVEKIVLISSIGADDVFFPLNLLFGVLFWKKRAEEAIQRSGLDYTIVRPGGLRDEPSSSREGPERIVMRGANFFGLPPRKSAGSITRKQVADVAVEALVEPTASRKVVEIIANTSAPLQSFADLFASVQ